MALSTSPRLTLIFFAFLILGHSAITVLGMMDHDQGRVLNMAAINEDEVIGVRFEINGKSSSSAFTSKSAGLRGVRGLVYSQLKRSSERSPPSPQGNQSGGNSPPSV